MENSLTKTLYDYIFKSDKLNITKLSDTQKLIIIYGISSGMLYLHSHNIIHRDLILRHIFLDDLLYPKITGFNFAIEHTENLSKGQISKGIYRTKNYEYIAPEILSKLEYSKSSDVYAFSIILY